MGTSTVHRSPSTSRWLLVNSLYEDPDVGVRRILAEIVNAAEEYAVGLADSAVLTRVEALLEISQVSNGPVERDEALARSRDAIELARRSSLALGATSFFGDLADKALHATVVSGVTSLNEVATAPSALRTFLGNLIAVAVDHLVSRDLSAHLGKGRVSSASDALLLRRSIIQHARALATTDRSSAAVASAAEDPRGRWTEAVAAAWSPRTANSVADQHDSR